jgi:hypothetical protein
MSDIGEDLTGAELLQQAADQLADEGGYVHIYRRGSRGKKYAYVTRLSVDEFAPDEVQEEWGGGTYQFRFYAASGKHHRSHTMEIEGPAKTIPAREPTDRDILASALERLEQRIEERLSGPAASPVLEMLAVVTQMQAPYVEALLSRSGGDDAGVSRLLEGLHLGLELSRTGEMPRTPWDRITDQLMPRIARLIDGTPPAAEEPVGLIPTPTPIANLPLADVVPPPPPPPAPAPDAPAWIRTLEPWLIALQGRALARKSAEVAADLLLEDLADHHLELVADVVAAPAAADILCHHWPPARAHIGWWRALLDRLREGIGVQPDDASADAAADAAAPTVEAAPPPPDPAPDP